MRTPLPTTPKKPVFKINKNIVPETPKKPRAVEQKAYNVSHISWDFEESVSLDKEMNFYYYIGPNKTSLVIEDVGEFLPGSADEDRYGNYVFRIQTNSQSLMKFAKEIRAMNPGGDWQFAPAGNAMQEGLLIMKMKITDEGLGHYLTSYSNTYAGKVNGDVVSTDDVKRYLEKQKTVTVKFGVGVFFNVVKRSYGLFTMLHSIG